jgi:hypothetical protein
MHGVRSYRPFKSDIDSSVASVSSVGGRGSRDGRRCSSGRRDATENRGAKPHRSHSQRPAKRLPPPSVHLRPVVRRRRREVIISCKWRPHAPPRHSSRQAVTGRGEFPERILARDLGWGYARSAMQRYRKRRRPRRTKKEHKASIKFFTRPYPSFSLLNFSTSQPVYSSDTPRLISSPNGDVNKTLAHAPRSLACSPLSRSLGLPPQPPAPRPRPTIYAPGIILSVSPRLSLPSPRLEPAARTEERERERERERDAYIGRKGSVAVAVAGSSLYIYSYILARWTRTRGKLVLCCWALLHRHHRPPPPSSTLHRPPPPSSALHRPPPPSSARPPAIPRRPSPIALSLAVTASTCPSAAPSLSPPSRESMIR